MYTYSRLIKWRIVFKCKFFNEDNPKTAKCFSCTYELPYFETVLF